MPIARWLDSERLNRMTKHFQFLLKMIRESDGELELALRGSYFNIYHRGNSLAKVVFLAEGNYRVEISSEFCDQSLALKDGRFGSIAKVCSGNRTVFVLPPDLLHPFFQKKHLDDFRSQIKKRNYCEETTYEQMVITDNTGRDDLLIIDRQVTDPICPGQMDILALEHVDGNRYRFLILEVKLGNNPELKGKVVAQMERYADHISAHFHDYKDCYERIYVQKRQLGLVDYLGYETIEIVNEAEARIIVIGYSGIARNAIKHLLLAHPKVNVQQYGFRL